MGKKTGFSLLEVLVAFDLLAMALFFIVGMVPFDNASVKQDAHILIANRLGQELLHNIASGFWGDGTDESGIPFSSQWDGFSKFANVNGASISPALYCLSTACPTGTTTDTLDNARSANTLFPPYPFAPVCPSGTCNSVSDFGNILISTTSDGIPDSRQYYFYVDTEPVNDLGSIVLTGDPTLEPDLRYVQVVVFWQEQYRPGMTPGSKPWQQAGFHNIILTGTLARKVVQ